MNSITNISDNNNNDNIEIFNQEHWPHIDAIVHNAKQPVRGPEYSPKDVKKALDMYAHTTKSIKICLATHHISQRSFYRSVLDLYPEIRRYLYAARGYKCMQFEAAALDAIEQLPEENAYFQTDRQTGHLVLTTAGANIMIKRADLYLRLAAIAESGTYIPRQQVESKNMNLHVHTSARKINGRGLHSVESADDLSDILRAATS